MRVSFGEYVLDTEARQLARGGTRVHLEPKALALLELLVARHPAAVSKSEIQRRLWPDTFVSESSLTGLMAQLRKALDDDRAQGRFLRTVHGFGYAFTAEITTSPAGDGRALARLVWEESVFSLPTGEVVLGRDEEADIRIDAPDVSRRHARLVVTDTGATIEDLASKNGTFVGEEPVAGVAPLRDGDRIRLGRQLLVFRRGRGGVRTWTETPPPRSEE